LDIKKGWLAFGKKDYVIPFPKDRDLDKIIEQRLILFEDPKFQRFGIVDLLSMLFSADCTPRSSLSDLRDAMPGYRQGESPQRSAERIALPGGETVPGESWDSPEGSPARYRIRKSSRTPFNLIDVSFNLPSKASISLELGEHVLLKDRPYKSLLSSEAALSTREDETARRLKELELTNKNSRVWTWTHQDRTYKAYAEYGGTTKWVDAVHETWNVTVILRDRRGSEILVRSGDLSPDDWIWARNGRYWDTFKVNNEPQQRLLIQDKNDTLVFQKRNSEQQEIRSFDSLFESDETWIVALRKSRKVKDLEVKPEKWLDFAPYIR
jgi:hypothetical protein